MSWIGEPVERATIEPAVTPPAVGTDRLAAGEIIHHPAAPAIRRTRGLDAELLDWWRAAPDGLDDATWEELLAVLQRRHHESSILDYSRQRLAACADSRDVRRPDFMAHLSAS